MYYGNIVDFVLFDGVVYSVLVNINYVIFFKWFLKIGGLIKVYKFKC